jgi:hypothetical protein
MLALVYPLFVTKHKLFVPAMSIVTHTQLTGNTSLLCIQEVRGPNPLGSTRGNHRQNSYRLCIYVPYSLGLAFPNHYQDSYLLDWADGTVLALYFIEQVNIKPDSITAT